MKSPHPQPNEPLEPFDEWYAKTKDYGGTREEYDKLLANRQPNEAYQHTHQFNCRCGESLSQADIIAKTEEAVRQGRHEAVDMMWTVHDEECISPEDCATHDILLRLLHVLESAALRVSEAKEDSND